MPEVEAPATVRPAPRTSETTPTTTTPWEAPELTALHRLAMHAVPHEDRLELDGRWRFQLLPRPDADPGAAWDEVSVPGCWTMQGYPVQPRYTNVQMPFDDRPPHPPADNPTGLYERAFEVPARWSERRIVLHVGAAESVLIATLNGREVGISKDSHLPAEFDVTALVRPGANTLTFRVVKWSDASYVEDQDQWWHGGITRSVFLFATPPIHPADIRAIGGLADDLRTGTLDVALSVAFPEGHARPGWTVAVRLTRVEEPGVTVAERSAEASAVRPDLGRKATPDDIGAMHRRGAGEPMSAEQAADWPEVYDRLAPPPEGVASWHLEVPDVRTWSPE